jgi:hypothetical protein
VRIRTRDDCVKKVMETLDPQTIGILATCAGLSFAMVWLATKLNVLDERGEARCPACGVIRRRGSCNCLR